jgi:transcription antitermination protein NusB
MSTASRRHARILALQTLYEIDSTDHSPEAVLLRNVQEPISENTNPTEPPDEGVRDYTTSLVEGVLQNRDTLDHIIEDSAPSWPLDQMAKIDKNILRLAIFEILFDNRVPLKAAINEAVELGKRFGSESSSRFVNGVLGTVAANQPQRGRKTDK